MSAEFFIGISYVGGGEYVRRAVASLGKYSRNCLIVDSSSDVEPLQGAFLVYHPVVPLTHTQTHVLFQRQAKAMLETPFYFVMHADAEASEEIVEALAARAMGDIAEGKKIAVWFTAYDALAAYSTAAAREVGEWNWPLWPSYYSECDYYWRCKVAGYALRDTGLPVKHVGSHVINKVDKWRKYYTQLRMPHWAELYQECWGGHPGHEMFMRPFNIDPAIGPFPEE